MEKNMDICVARQPIFDKKKRVIGYEFLHRSSADAEWADEMAGMKIASQK